MSSRAVQAVACQLGAQDRGAFSAEAADQEDGHSLGMKGEGEEVSSSLMVACAVVHRTDTFWGCPVAGRPSRDQRCHISR